MSDNRVSRTREALGREGWAAYMRAWRRKHGLVKSELPRDEQPPAKPDKALLKTDKPAYYRQYRRWVRGGRP